MRNIAWTLAACLFCVCSLTITTLRAQSNNASITGEITDPNGAVIQGAKVTLISKDTKQTSNYVSDGNGYYSFRNVLPGTYQLSMTASGFAQYTQEGILVRVGYPIRQDVQLKLQAAAQSVDVAADVSALNYENAELRGSIDPQVIQDVPLLVGGSMRSAANFASLLPGVVRGSGDVSGAHVNGGQSQTGIAVLDGIALFNSSGTQGLTGAVNDFPQSPDVISEFQVLTSNYDAQYGSAGGVTIENVKSGTNSYHGTAFEFHRDRALNAAQWGIAASDKAQDIENDFGGNFGGPLKLPFWKDQNHRTFFFANFEAFRIRGALTRPTLSIPSIAERQGDFRDWTDPQTGNLIPIYDPATHQQFMGCDGNTPNVICATDPRLQNSLAKQWFQFLPNPTSPGPQNNYLAPAQPAFLGTDADSIMEKVDQYLGSKDHISEMFYYKYLPPTTFTSLPDVISDTGTTFKRTSVLRLNWDHTFNPNTVNHVAFGFQDDKAYGGGIDGKFAGKLPQIPGVASHQYPPVMRFNGEFEQYGTGSGDPNIQPWLAPAWIVNDAVSMTRGKHTISFGGEMRLAQNSAIFLGGQSGSFDFARGETGIIAGGTLTGGSPIASFLLEQVDNSQTTFYTTTKIDARTNGFMLFVGDTWRVTPKLTISPGLHYEIDPSPYEVHNHFSYFDPNLSNPGAGNLPGAVAYAGSGPGRSGRRAPEDTWYGGIGPRLGVAYALTAKTVIRSGYGIFYDNANMPGWASGISQDGYNANASFSSSQGGTQAAFILSDGFPSNHPVPPNLVPTFDNGANTPNYRPRTANRLPYTQQWNLTVEHQFTGRDYVAASYVGTKGTRLLSHIAPLNVVNPSFLSMGAQLNDQFQPGDTQVDGVPLPFPNFVDTMTGCAPSVAQALLPFPQYCNNISGLDENQGSSTYHAFQMKAEHRFSRGLWALLSYTNSKLITNADNTENIFNPTYFSPFEIGRNRSLAIEDVPQALNIASTYELPFGRGKPWLNQGLANVLLGGWALNGVYRFQSGIPFQLSSSFCNVPAQLNNFCSPALLAGASPFSQSPTHFDPSQPVLNVNSFEPASSFNFYTGKGPRVQNFRQPGYSDFDIGLEKSIHITERFKFQLRGDAFNIFNQHHFNNVGTFLLSGGTGGSAFNTDVASPNFGLWNGVVTSPRNIQVSGRISF
jgi:Carboxypeptidase regulatory-like domain